MKIKFFFSVLCVLMMCLVACKQNEPNIPETVVGAFSVSATKQVRFAPGNLQYHDSTNTWRFAEHQYDFIGDDNMGFLDSYSGWRDLFGWGTGNNSTNISTDNSDYSTFVDWGTNKIDSFAPNTWRTLSSEEWEYIFKKRRNAFALYGSAIVNNQPGVIVFPDNTPVPESFMAGLHCYSGGGYRTNWYYDTEWTALEKQGVLFLPASGCRYGADVLNVKDTGYYWSSTPFDESSAYAVSFRDIQEWNWIRYEESFFFPRDIRYRYIGLAVRLAQDL